MSPRTKISYIVFAVIIIAAVVAIIFFVVPRKPSADVLNQRLEEIKNLAVTQKNCEAALPKAKDLVKQAPEMIEAWDWKGVCEFQLGKFDEAKATFHKVLTLDPRDKPAHNYLNILASGGTLTNAKVSGALTGDDIESRLGVRFDPGHFTFLRAVPIPPNEQFVEFISATYISSSSLNVALQYVKDLLLSNNISYTVKQDDSQAVVYVTPTDTKVTYAINITRNQGGTIMSVSFNKRK